jgi:hypothetical protein
MNDSTAGVTIRTGLVFDVLAEYRSVRQLCAPVFELASRLDPSRVDEWCEMQLYNDVCAWIEGNVGASSIRRAGAAIGGRIHARTIANRPGTEPETTGSEPLAVMEAVSRAAATMIRDPDGRGFEIRSRDPKRIEMRRTQTFNCLLQEGLLLALVERTGVLMPSVRQIRCTRQNDEFCDYEVRWLRDARPGRAP